MTITTAQNTLLKTPLADWHAAHEGRMVDFAGWLMPVQYTSIVAEHLATRQAATLFDVSHMGRIAFTGPAAADFLDRLVTRNVKTLQPGQVRYALITNDTGGILDDVLVYCLPAANQQVMYQLVVNASNREKILAWIEAQQPDAQQVTIEDRTQATAMIAVQGPRAIELLRPLSAIDPASLKYYSAVQTTLGDVPCLLGRTGYTGEDGWELVVPAEAAVKIWETLLKHGEVVGAKPAGLGCRDTLRLEAAMPLYGHELNENINPYQAGLGFAVNLSERTFPGRDALAKLKDQPQPVRVGLQLNGKRVPREHYTVLVNNQPIGEVTSGTFSPTFDYPLAMAYLEPAYATLGTEVVVDIRGKQESAKVVALPFYKRA